MGVGGGGVLFPARVFCPRPPTSLPPPPPPPPPSSPVRSGCLAACCKVSELTPLAEVANCLHAWRQRLTCKTVLTSCFRILERTRRLLYPRPLVSHYSLMWPPVSVSGAASAVPYYFQKRGKGKVHYRSLQSSHGLAHPKYPISSVRLLLEDAWPSSACGLLPPGAGPWERDTRSVPH